MNVQNDIEQALAKRTLRWYCHIKIVCSERLLPQTLINWEVEEEEGDY